MRKDPLMIRSIHDKKGITLIELLVVLVISGIVIGGVYRIFISQTRAYTVQDQVAELQQDVRGAMEIMVRDVRMAGFQARSSSIAAITNNPIATPLSDNGITVNYQYIPPPPGVAVTNTVTYALAGGILTRTLNGVAEPLLNNVANDAANPIFSYGIDADGDGGIDGIDEDTGVIPDASFVAAAAVGTAKVLAIRMTLTTNPPPDNPDVVSTVSPRTLTSVVIPRNLILKKYSVY
jgi:prepilin-type N-terminal cleavage/methylation domain-containing protein